MRPAAPGPPPAFRQALDPDISRWLSNGCGTHVPVEPVMTLTGDGHLFLEGRGGARSCAAALELRQDGLLAPRLLLTCQLVEPPPPREQSERPPLRPLLERYFTALDEGRFAHAGSCFAEDCLYVHPPYGPGEPPAIFRGRATLVRQWPLKRGRRRVETRIERCVQAGNHAFVQGRAAAGTFLSSVVLDDDGLISRYVAFYAPDAPAGVSTRVSLAREPAP